MNLRARALLHNRRAVGRLVIVGLEAEPREIFENRRFVLGTRSLAIVIFDPEEHPPSDRTRESPHVYRIDDMAQVKVTGR